MLILLLTTLSAQAESWCATPLVAHEWGVTRINAADEVAIPTPSWFGQAVAAAPTKRVRDLPADTGIRDLPVVQIYAPVGGNLPAPFAMEVGFTKGQPSAWWPPVDALATSGPRQLAWDALSLAEAPVSKPRSAEVAWVEALRAVPGALWVNRGADSERFVFYEGRTAESSALVVRRGETWSPTRPHYILENRSERPVHDVVFIADGRAWTAPSIPAHKTAGFLLDAPLDAKALRAELRRRWVSGEADRSADKSLGDSRGCVMMRDPAVPFAQAVDHQLYGAEVDVMLDLWADRLFAAEGVHLVYREDVGALDEAVPVRLYTDMYHHVDWHRLGVVVVEGLSLPVPR